MIVKKMATKMSFFLVNYLYKRDLPDDLASGRNEAGSLFVQYNEQCKENVYLLMEVKTL